mmetsp:Transcript_8106/g.22443  ORF Transcript_8106/g.22443 Transcript_8106/m.22443 type:complete len:189 (-) Transcript_8106:155-721(-)
MSFAASLSQTCCNTKARFEHDIDQWAFGQVEKFKAACQKIAETEGSATATADTEVFTTVVSMSTAFASLGEVLEAVTNCLQRRLDELGFTSCKATAHDKLNIHGRSTCMFSWLLYASWAGVQAQDVKEQPSPTGLSATCPVCLDTKAVVALVPCGHGGCGACAGKFVKAACPSCRQRVTCMTTGIFVG